MSDVIVLAANQVGRRPYRGGRRIARFRGIDVVDEYSPEDWVASTTPIFGDDRIGLSLLPDGRLLAGAIEADPLRWLGPAHLEKFGADPKLLTKLLDAGERLFVHAHPSDEFAGLHGFASGKAEAWFVLEGGPIYLGLRERVDRRQLLELSTAQDTEALLDLLNRVHVSPGDVVGVPPGVLHAIGEGLFLVEVQQAADLSILLEWKGFPIDGLRDGNLGLGLEVALGAIETTARPDLGDLILASGPGESILPREMDPYVRLERHVVTGPARIGRGFAVLVASAGEVVVDDVPLPRGTTAVLPYGSGDLDVTGRGELLVARPPRA